MNLDDITEMQIPRLAPIEIICSPHLTSESKTEIKLIGYYRGVFGNNVESILAYDTIHGLTSEEVWNFTYTTRKSVDADRIISLTVLEPKK